MKYKFDCGCEIDVVDDEIKECDDLPSLTIDYYNLPDCPATWELIKSGQTKGIFQLETNLGKKWARRVLPNNIEELAALISLMRPGVLRAMVNKYDEEKDEMKQVSMADLYCARKNLGEELEYLHPSLEPILKETQAILLYQEQAIRIAQDIAGFSGEEGETLRKAIGKKKADIMAKIKVDFLEHCQKTNIVNKEESEQIFGWIQESQRYSFNKSHAVEYGTTGYWSAYSKTHFPLHFFTSWLYFSHEKIDPQEEMQKLISDAKNFNIQVCPPSLKELYNGDLGHFSMRNGKIYFGIEDIKRIGKAHVQKVFDNVKIVEEKLGKSIKDWSWFEFLIYFSDKIGSTVVNNLVAAGATDYMGGNRSEKIHQYNEWRKLTIKEQEWIQNNCINNTTLISCIYDLLQNRQKTSITRRKKIEDIVKILEKPTFGTYDDAHYIANHEQELLGIPLTCSKLDACPSDVVPDTTCKEFLEGKTGKFLIRVEIIGVGEYLIKRGKSKGQKMLFLQVEDDTGVLDSVVVFPDVMVGNEPYLINGSTVLLKGDRDTKYNKDSFIVESIIPI